MYVLSASITLTRKKSEENSGKISMTRDILCLCLESKADLLTVLNGHLAAR